MTRHLGSDIRAVLLVEGSSDRAAVETLAARYGRDLAGEGVEVVDIGGASKIQRHLDELGGRGLMLAGLCDEAEEKDFARALELAGLGATATRRDVESLGFYVCVRDLEEELIRALGAEAVVEVIEFEGEGGPFRSFQNQPAWRGRPVDEQLRRFMGTHSGRKTRYGEILVGALELDHVPRPLEAVLNRV